MPGTDLGVSDREQKNGAHNEDKDGGEETPIISPREVRRPVVQLQ